MTVEAICKRLVYGNLDGTYRVYAFRPTNPESEMNLTKYGDFTIAGEREFTIDKVYMMDVEPNKDSKYPASYQFIKYTGMEYDGKRFAVEPQMRFKVLSSYMTEGQAMSCLDAYPDFIDRVLMDNVDSIDVNKIKGVGNILLNKYTTKLKEDTYSIMFGTVLSKYGDATPKACKLAAEKYVDPDDLERAIVEDPYETLCVVLDKKVKSVDKFVRDVKPEYLESKSRCRRAVFDLLDEMEEEGSTRCNANALAKVVQTEYPECIKWIHEVITESPELYFDTATKYVSLLKTFQNEVFVAKQIIKRVKSPVRFEGDTEQFRQIGEATLTDEQLEGVAMVRDNSVGMLTGNSGVGKSTSTLAIAHYLESINKSYVLLAPTGCAAKRLHEATDRKASTIHMWIMKMLPSDKKDDFNYSPTDRMKCQADVVICDEASMLSVDLVAKIFDWVSDHTKVFFVCDPAQLASISCGNFAQNLMDSNVVPITRLTKVFRYNTSGIATVVTDTRNGTTKSIEDKYDDYHFVQQADTASEVIDQISKVYQHFLKKGHKMMDILCLCPYNRGQIGTRIINNVLQEKFNKNPYLDMGYVVDDTNVNFKIGDKVINTKNSYSAKLYPPCYTKKGEEYYKKTFLANGDIGRIDCVFDDLLVCDFDGRLVVFEKPEFRNLSLAYAISCHKSQGQESPVVIALMLRQHTYMINRNIEYVAFSRAKKELCVIGDKKTIARGMRDVQNLQRDTWLVDLLTGRKI